MLSDKVFSDLKEVCVAPSETLTQMTGIEYLTPDGQQLTLDVTAWWRGGGFSAKVLVKVKIFRQSFHLIKCLHFNTF